MPCTQSDRIWCTRSMKTSGWLMLPQDTPSYGPQIAFNPKARHYGLYKPFLCPPPISTRDSDDNGPSDWNEGHQDRDHNRSPVIQQSCSHHSAILEQVKQCPRTSISVLQKRRIRIRMRMRMRNLQLKFYGNMSASLCI